MAHEHEICDHFFLTLIVKNVKRKQRAVTQVMIEKKFNASALTLQLRVTHSTTKLHIVR